MLLKSLAYARLSFTPSRQVVITDPINTIDYSLLEPISSVEEFLKSNFKASGSKLKKYFDKSFLNRSFTKHATLSLPLNFVNDGEINPEYIGPQIDIIFDDENFLVMNKPANLFVHPLVYDEKNNCLSFLRVNKAACLAVNTKNYDRGLLYRLDFETSGVLVYVKNEEAYQYLREHFKTIAKKKTYLCVVEGECRLNGNFTHYFSSKEIKGKRVIVSDNESKGERGELSLRPLHYDSRTSTTLMEVDLKSGLRHQIRAQLAHMGFPLRGDLFYGGKAGRRLYLHAFNYQLEYQNQNYSFEIEPKDFNGL
ncbi:MAG: RNA pseudouridine synthase [Bacteriovorax sp.]|nr:RNA pseudouridine synthase [Bacteriovorax sp.]